MANQRNYTPEFREEAKREIFKYIETYYNRLRRHRADALKSVGALKS